MQYLVIFLLLLLAAPIIISTYKQYVVLGRLIINATGVYRHRWFKKSQFISRDDVIEIGTGSAISGYTKFPCIYFSNHAVPDNEREHLDVSAADDSIIVYPYVSGNKDLMDKLIYKYYPALIVKY